MIRAMRLTWTTAHESRLRRLETELAGLKAHRRLCRDDRTNEILTARAGGASYAEIAKSYGVSRQRIHQIVKSAASLERGGWLK